MAKSISNIISEMIEMYPNIRSVADSTLLSRLKSAQEELYQFVGKEYSHKISNVTTTTTVYTMPDDYRDDNLIRVIYYKNENVTEKQIPRIIDTDLDEIKVTNEVWRTSPGIALERTVDEQSDVYVVYRQKPLDISLEPSDWDTTYPVIDDEYVDLLIYKVIKSISSYGDVPDISISNNYEREYIEKFAKAKSDFYKRRMRNKANKQSYKKYWWEIWIK